jgi:formate hydrogenlyase transcriptional activator
VLDVPAVATPPRAHAQSDETAPETLEQAERRHILSALTDSHWVLAGPHGAAARLGMKRSTLQFRMRKLGITRP